MASQLAEQHEMYRSNVLPAMLGVLADQLGVTNKSLTRLQIGWKIDENAWVFPERDADGEIIGLIRRFWNGKKFCFKGSKRGLVFPATAIVDGYNASRQQWQRVTEADPCPICGKPDWCGYDASDPPKFVRCMRVSENSVYTDRGKGFIHELIKGTFRPPAHLSSPLPKSDWPIIVVEGATDVTAALDLGFVAVGRPSATGGLEFLIPLLHGRSAAIIGENDAGIGMEGMEQIFEGLRSEIPSVIKVRPPADIKDLRDWVRHGLTQTDLLDAIKHGNQDQSGHILESKAPLDIAKLWLREAHWNEGLPTLRLYKGEWFQFNGRYYEPVDEIADIRGRLYAFLGNKTFKKFSSRGELRIEKYEITRAKINDIIDAMSMMCPIAIAPPCWLDFRLSPQPHSLINFRNGILNIEAYMQGTIELLPPNSLLFSTTATLYDFNPVATYPRWRQFLSEIFSDDQERIALLQEWFGYNLVTDTSLQKFMLFVGRPASGKSTTLGVLQALLGRDQVAQTSFKHLCSDFGLQPLMGKLAAILPDAHIPRQVDAIQALETIKSIVGGDGVSINRKFLPQLPDHKLVCRLTIAVNELPEFPDHMRAMERRLNLLHFPETFEGREDRTLADVLAREAPGIAVWALNGLKRLRLRGQFTLPKSSVPVIATFRRCLSPVAEFISECCIIGEEYQVDKLQLYDAWIKWAKKNGLATGTQVRFGQRLLAQVPSCKSLRPGSNTGPRPRLYGGITLTDRAKELYLGRPGS